MMRPMPASMRLAQLPSPLLLPWKWQRAAGKPADERDGQLAARDDVQADPLVARDRTP